PAPLPAVRDARHPLRPRRVPPLPVRRGGGAVGGGRDPGGARGLRRRRQPRGRAHAPRLDRGGGPAGVRAPAVAAHVRALGPDLARRPARLPQRSPAGADRALRRAADRLTTRRARRVSRRARTRGHGVTVAPAPSPPGPARTRAW